MSLKKLIEQKRINTLGINSGTSVDGVDLALLSVWFSPDGSTRVKVLGHSTVRYPQELRELIMKLSQAPHSTVEEIALADEALGVFFGRKAKAFIDNLRKKNYHTHLISSHGQTIRHIPESKNIAGISVRATFQIGAPERIATLTGIPVVSHFRQAHVAFGGEGSPITTGAIASLLSSRTENRIVVNIGGIANVFDLPASYKLNAKSAFDCGPGNVLIDLATSKLFGKPYDRGGEIASSGTLSSRLLTLISSNEFFDYTGAKSSGRKESKSSSLSTGRERYSAAALEKIIKSSRDLKISNRDMISTLSELTALKIAEAIFKILKYCDTNLCVYLTGGGLKNRDLIKRIRRLLHGIDVKSVAKLGYHPDYLEAISYAVMGYWTLKGKPTLAPEIIARRRGINVKKTKPLAPVLGRLIQAPQRKAWDYIAEQNT
ncbi:MAG: anhydro-N-acetylmuramic acid kinase [candidate division Zixibacteria bacterium]|nr:anhydro-N-acetylmuramic acid kinase [candidate division Zixibacteria bacterium]